MNTPFFSRIILVFIAAQGLCGSVWSSESWPGAILELERAALRDPRPGTAWLNLRQYAITAGRYSELRQRWEAGGAAGLILLGWLDIEAGEMKAARGRFERAVEIAPKNHHAWLALAELQLRAGEAAGEVSAATAAELAADEASRVRALRLPGVTAQERGDLAAAWAAWKKLEAAPLAPAVRVALIPDFARAHLAIGDADEWSARLVAAAPDSADAAAHAAAACLALRDPALAHRLATAALEKDRAHPALLKLAIDAARGAGFNGEAAARIETALGEAPDDDALVSALAAFTKLGAPDHAVRLCRRHAARLAPIATRWRRLLPACSRLGTSAELRAIFTPLEKAGGWELRLALAELAILEDDHAAAVPWLWRLYDAEFDARELGAAAFAPGRRMDEALLSVTGHGFQRRFAELQTLTRARPTVFATDSAGRWTTDAVYSSVNSVSGARDLALAYLQSIALREGGGAGEKFRTQLRARMARWPADERLLAWATVGGPAEVFEAAAEVLARPGCSVEVGGFVRSQLARVRGVPDLPAKLLTAADNLAARLAPEEPPHAGLPTADLRSVRALFSVMDDEVPPPGQPSIERRWRRDLRACWALLEKGRFADADARFAECLQTLGSAGLGPSGADWARFHCATFQAIGSFDDKGEEIAAASCALRWLALQSPRRADWPAAGEPTMVWQTGAPRLTTPMFYSDRQGDFFVWLGSLHGHFRTCGGSVPDDVLCSLALTIALLSSSSTEVPLRTDGLPPESVRLLELTGFIQTIYRGMWNGRPVGTTTKMEQMFGTADGALARLLATRFQVLLHEKKSAPAGELPDFLMPGKPTGPVGRGPWLVAKLKMTARETPPADVRALAAELAALPLDAENHAGAREALGLIAAARPPAEAAEWKALAGRLAVARLRASPAEPLPDDWAERMTTLTAAGKNDEALALARRTLATPTAGVLRAEFMWRAQMQAFRTLHELGALDTWIGVMRKTAQAGTVEDWRWLATACQMMQQVIPEKEPPTSAPAGDQREHPDAALRRESKAAFDEASLALTRLEPDRSLHWYQLHLSRSPQGGPLGPLSAAGIDLEALTRGAGPGFTAENAAQFLGNDLDQLSALLERWPVCNLRVPDSPHPDTALGQQLAVRLWRGGKKEAALRWLQKLFRACDASAANAIPLRTILLEAHALRGDRAGLVDVFARTLRDSIEIQDGASGFPARDYWGHPARYARPLRPIFEQAARLGLTGDLRTKLESADDPVTADLALLLRAEARDATVLAALSPRLDAALPRQMIKELAELLAPWPEARATAEKTLRLLEPTRARQSTAERTAELAHHGLLAAQCGMKDEAGRWLREALAAQRVSSYTLREFTPTWGGATALGMRSDFRVNVLLDVFEGFSLAKEATLAAEAEAEIGKLLPRATTLSNSAPLRVQKITAARDPAAGSTKGEWELQSPAAWLHRLRDDGTAEVGWALGQIRPDEKGRAKTFTTHDQALAFSRGKPLRVELYYGTSPERLVRFATVENAAPTGKWLGRLPRPAGVLAASFFFDGQTVMGPPLPFSFAWKELLPPLDGQLANLPKLMWSRGTVGPGGESLRGLMTSGILEHTELALPVAGLQRLTVSGWVRNGTVELVVFPPNAPERVIHTHTFYDSEIWQRFEFEADTLVSWLVQESKDSRCVLRLRTGEYSDLRVATKTKPH